MDAFGVAAVERTPDELAGRRRQPRECLTSWRSPRRPARLLPGAARGWRPRPRPTWPGAPASTSDTGASGSSRRPATGILEVDDVDAAPEDCRFSLPDAYAEPLLDRTSPWSISPVGRAVVACAKVLPLRPLKPAAASVGGLWRGHDRVAGRLQPALAGQLVRVGDPAGHPDIHRRLEADPPAPTSPAVSAGWRLPSPPRTRVGVDATTSLAGAPAMLKPRGSRTASRSRSATSARSPMARVPTSS